MQCFHATNASAARAIVESQTFLCGRGGMVGAGIYFAVSEQDARRKQQHGGDVLLSAMVRLGQQHVVAAGGDSTICAKTLAYMGKDSVMLLRENGYEYVVYQSDQVSDIQYV
jgi:hypothetical protein